MGLVGAREGGMGLTRQIEIVGVTSLAGQQPPILEAHDRLAYAG